jgi:hypothetical protein
LGMAPEKPEEEYGWEILKDVSPEWMWMDTAVPDTWLRLDDGRCHDLYY